MAGGVDLDVIRARADAATDGPWRRAGRCSVESEHECSNTHTCRGIAETSGMGPAPYEQWRDQELADAEFIAHARTDVPALVAEVERLRAASNAATASAGRAWMSHSAMVDRAGAAGSEVERLTAVLGAVAALVDEWADDGEPTATVPVSDLRAVLAPVSGAVEGSEAVHRGLCPSCGDWHDDDGGCIEPVAKHEQEVRAQVEVIEALTRLGDGALAWAGDPDAVHEDVGIVRAALDAARADALTEGNGS